MKVIPRDKFGFVFLAAGRGVRMGSLTKQVPKALLPLHDGRSIISTNMDNLTNSDLRARVIIVGSHGWGRLVEFIESSRDKSITAELNTDYDKGGPIRSIMVGLDAVRSSACVAIANGDTVFSTEVFNLIAEAKPGLSLVISTCSKTEVDDMLAALDHDQYIRSVAKAGCEIDGGMISAGILVAKGERFVAKLHSTIYELNSVGGSDEKAKPWHSVFAELYDKSYAVTPLFSPRPSWREFDYQSCLTMWQPESD